MILILGGLGFIGSHVTRALLDMDESCVVAQRRTGTMPGAAVEQVDVTDLDSLLAVGERHEITSIVYLPGGFGLDRNDPVGGVRIGVTGLVNLFEVALRWQVTRISMASTIGIYDMARDAPWREDMPLPLTAGHPIPAAKKVGEVIGDYIGGAAGIDVVHHRIGAAWGPGGRTASPFFAVPQMVHHAVHPSDTPPPVAYAEDGSDIVYVKDCGRAIAMLHTAERLTHHVYNVSGGRHTTYGEVAEAIGKVVPDAKLDLRDGRDPQGFGRDLFLDISRLREDTGYRPAYDTESSVRDYIGWLRSGNER